MNYHPDLLGNIIKSNDKIMIRHVMTGLYLHSNP